MRELAWRGGPHRRRLVPMRTPRVPHIVYANFPHHPQKGVFDEETTMDHAARARGWHHGELQRRVRAAVVRLSAGGPHAGSAAPGSIRMPYLGRGAEPF